MVSTPTRMVSPHDDRIIAAEGRIDEKLADPAGREIDVDHDRSRDHQHECRPQIGQDRQHRGFERMAQNDPPCRQALGTRRADETGVQHFEHG